MYIKDDNLLAQVEVQCWTFQVDLVLYLQLKFYPPPHHVAVLCKRVYALSLKHSPVWPLCIANE